MNPDLSIKLENKVAAILECNVQLKNKGLPLEDTTYILKIKLQYIQELTILIQENSELSHHPALLKVQNDLESIILG